MKIENNQMQNLSVVMIRHAQSLWNKQNRFTGWANPPLTEAGVVEAVHAGILLKNSGFQFDIAYSSRLQRAINTTELVLDAMRQSYIPQYQDWRLNERHYGVLQGFNKTDAAAEAGEHQVWRWRRGYEDRAEPLLVTDNKHPRHDPLYADVDPQILPGVENLAQTRERVIQFWQEHIVQHINNHKRVLISAHGNTLRALLMALSDMSIAEVESFEIPTATPIVYEFDETGKPIMWDYLLNETIEKLSA